MLESPLELTQTYIEQVHWCMSIILKMWFSSFPVPINMSLLLVYHVEEHDGSHFPNACLCLSRRTGELHSGP